MDVNAAFKLASQWGRDLIGGAENLTNLIWVALVLAPIVIVLLFAWGGARTGLLARLSAVASGAVALGYAGLLYAFLIEPRSLLVREIAIASPAWSGPPLRIGIVSDTHVSPGLVTPDRVRAIVARMNAEHPDLVVLLGDYARGRSGARFRPAHNLALTYEGVDALAGLEAPLGRIAILGNHDWWFDGTLVEQRLEAAGLPVLENEARRVYRPGGAFWVAGVADPSSERARPDLGATLEAIPRGADVVLLSHAPDTFAETPDSVALTLSGHTHCGQVRLPVFGALIHASPLAAIYPGGVYAQGARRLFVTCGIGTSILPLRLGAPPEIVVVTISPARLPAPAS
jgi:predicted MPP superfamily phosphohydrolase